MNYFLRHVCYQNNADRRQEQSSFYISSPRNNRPNFKVKMQDRLKEYEVTKAHTATILSDTSCEQKENSDIATEEIQLAPKHVFNCSSSRASVVQLEVPSKVPSLLHLRNTTVAHTASEIRDDSFHEARKIKSGLSFLLKMTCSVDTCSEVDEKVVVGGEDIYDSVSLTVYLPDKTFCKLNVLGHSTTDQVIEMALRKSSQENKGSFLKSTKVSDYELRMHEDNGEPEDFAIERSAKIRDLNDDEFCILYVGHNEYSPLSSSGQASTSDTGDIPEGLVKVWLENDVDDTGDMRRPKYTVLKTEKNWSICDLLLEIARTRKEVRLLSHEEYELRLATKYTDRYSFWSEGSPNSDGVLPLETLLGTLEGVTELHLHRRTFCDIGLVNVHAGGRHRIDGFRGGVPADDEALLATEMKSDEEVLNKYYLRYTEIQVG